MNLNEINEAHRKIAEKLLAKVRDASGSEVFQFIQEYNAMLKVWQERINTESIMEQLEAQRGKTEAKPSEEPKTLEVVK